MKHHDKIASKLAERLQNPFFGYGAMHYSSLTPDAVREVFDVLNRDFRKRHKLLIPRLAQDAVDSGHGMKYKNAGCYWVMDRDWEKL